MSHETRASSVARGTQRAGTRQGEATGESVLSALGERVADEELMESVAGGSKQAFLELMERWQRGLFRFFRLLGACDHEAEDSVQETFLRVFAYRLRYRRTGASFRSFLFHVARNVSVDMARKRRRRAGWLSLQSWDPRESGSVDPTLAWNDRLDVRSALCMLPEKLRVVVVLNTFEGMSYREVAETLGVPLGTVKSRMHHAFLRLREVLHVGDE